MRHRQMQRNGLTLIKIDFDPLRQELDSLVFSSVDVLRNHSNVSHQHAATFTSMDIGARFIGRTFQFRLLNGWTMGNIAASASNTAAAHHLFSPNTKTPLVSQVL